MDNPDYDNEFYRIQDFLCDIPGIAGVLTNGKQNALLKIAFDAEDSRNLLM